jgi:hypothetical protein
LGKYGEQKDEKKVVVLGGVGERKKEKWPD